MKKSILLLLVLFLVSCSQATKSPAMILYELSREKQEDSFDITQVNINEVEVDKVNEVGLDTFEKLTKENKNQVYSPLSTYLAISMLVPMAKTSSQKELLTFLKQESVAELVALNRRLIQSIEFDKEKGLSKIANSVWMQEDEKFNMSLLESIGKDFYASLYGVDFRNEEETKKAITGWINKETNNFIKEIDVKTDPDTVLSLVNTIYFSNQWLDSFEKEANIKDEFKTSSGVVSVEYMRKNFSTYSYKETDKSQGLSIDYHYGYKAHFILPTEDLSVDYVKEYLERSDSSHRQAYLVNLWLPKFEVNSTHALVDVTNELGLEEVFTDRSQIYPYADDRTVMIGKIQQQARIQLDEKGTVAAAYTKIDLRPTSSMDQPIVRDLKLNKPFYFMITNQQGVITFITLVHNPIAE